MSYHTFFLFFFLSVIAAPIAAQPIPISITAGIRKTFNLNKKSALEIREQVQVNPEIEQYANEYGDFFNEDGFWSIPDRYRDDDDLDDDDNDLPPGAGTGVPDNSGELDDTPRYIRIDWRSTSSLQYTYRFHTWLRSNTAYALFYNGEEFRHTFRTEMDYRPLRHGGKKRKADMALRTMYQRIGRPDNDKMKWTSFLIPRMDADWAFKKNHTLVLSNALNGEWSDGKLAFDRWRMNASLVFTYSKIHRFTFAYQYQQRLDQPGRSHGLSFGYEVRL
jgi:hypothetical protein